MAGSWECIKAMFMITFSYCVRKKWLITNNKGHVCQTFLLPVVQLKELLILVCLSPVIL